MQPATTQNESIFAFATAHTGIILLLLTAVTGLCLYLLTERERNKQLELANKEKAYQDRIQILEGLVRQQSTAMAEAVNQMRLITDILHSRITGLSEDFHSLLGEHNSRVCQAQPITIPKHT